MMNTDKAQENFSCAFVKIKICRNETLHNFKTLKKNYNFLGRNLPVMIFYLNAHNFFFNLRVCWSINEKCYIAFTKGVESFNSNSFFTKKNMHNFLQHMKPPSYAWSFPNYKIIKLQHFKCVQFNTIGF